MYWKAKGPPIQNGAIGPPMCFLPQAWGKKHMGGPFASFCIGGPFALVYFKLGQKAHGGTFAPFVLVGLLPRFVLWAFCPGLF